ncbi:protein neprosin-like [Nicotiana tabacum]|uniref:Protein neprosin-like n=1 Tax=Nicotiana tabacum TaxID=4097 RepID=A0AC58UC58_TOBAC
MVTYELPVNTIFGISWQINVDGQLRVSIDQISNWDTVGISRRHLVTRHQIIIFAVMAKLSVNVQAMVMNQKVKRRTLLVLYFLLLSYNGVQGETKRYSKLEDLELEKQLKLLNKPAVKTIKTTYGDLYFCVNFYKQPAFDHPLMQNHNFHHEMKPTLHKLKQNSGTSTTSGLSTIWLNGEGCPIGTVPIKRIGKEDLIRQRHIPPPEDITFGVQLAVVAIARTQNDPNNKFGGATMAASLWNPHVEGQQHSACRLKIQKGSDIVQVGWRVDPTLYGDTKTRLFIHFQAGNIHCFNILCPGFVLVNTKIPIDMVYDTISQIGEASWEDTMSIDRDLVNGNWWLLLEEDYKQIGFWPQRIFTDLKSFATNVEWGGVVYSPTGVPGPPMDSGLLPIGNTGHEAYCRRITVLNNKGETIDEDKTTAYADNPNLYKVVDIPHWQAAKRQHFVLYGGPGENRQV